MRALVMGLLLVACAPPPPPTAKVWTVREFFNRRAESRPLFGGWAPGELLASEGKLIPFSTRTQGARPGLTVFPGVSEGQAIGFVITDLWQDHPEPWVQPVYVPVEEAPPYRRTEASTIFPVGLDSTFYSPWWRMQQVPLAEGVTLTSSQQVLEAGVLPPGPLVLCPIVVPGDLVIAAETADSPRHPLTDTPVAQFKTLTAFVDGQDVSYFDVGTDRTPFDGQRLVEADLFVFVRDDGTRLPVAAVWPPVPEAHSFLRRVDVPVPPGAAFFVPANRPDLRERLGALAPTVDASLDRFPEYGLRLARNPSCFSSPTFPTACEWLDSHQRVRDLPSTRRNVQLTAVVLKP